MRPEFSMPAGSYPAAVRKYVQDSEGEFSKSVFARFVTIRSIFKIGTFFSKLCPPLVVLSSPV
ncbi:hypothetical protein SAMN04487948_11582 [Halogranum amylolyticum]|uniref:Uncharacterized protein n=1 Tax=Halogranum amylolyticum TaxID=660520 RepID=A0A1H8VC39_9EURY|nr:hypothetical protein SAMN04487948_11582 [Halogranum amylolyticum]